MRIKKRYNETTAVKTPGLGTVGHIRIGEKAKSQNGKEYPVSLDYFKPDAPEQYMQFFSTAYGDKPAKLTITFLSNDLNEVCRQFYELRDGAGGRLAYGDGKTFYVATKQGDGTVKDVVTEPADTNTWMKAQESAAGKPWRERLVLRFALPQIPVLGLWEFSTHGGGSTIPNIVGAVDTMIEVAGRIAGIPFDLIVEKVKSDKAGSKSVYPVVSLIPNISQESASIVRGLPMQLGTILTEEKIGQLSSGQTVHTAEAQEPAFAEYEEIESTAKDIDIEALKDEIEKCFSNDELSVLYHSNTYYEKYKELFTARRKEIEQLIEFAGELSSSRKIKI